MVVGIATASICGAEPGFWVLLLVFSFSLMALSLFFERIAMLFGVAAMAAMFSVGGAVWSSDDATMAPRWEESKGEFKACFVEAPRMGDRTVKALAMLTRIDVDSVAGRHSGLAYLYLANCVAAEDLRIGDCIGFTGKVANPHNSGNPAEFDYEHYLHTKGVTATVYLPVGGWRRQGAEQPTQRMRALMLREHIVALYSRMGFDEDVKAVLSALTIGDKSELTREIKETYSSVGVSHILALSGLHLGIFYMVLSVVIPLWRRKRLYMVAREVFIVAVLWLFALVAGFSPSVVRAATLFTLLSVARCARRDNTSLNSLAFAAIAMLLFSPRSLFDVSFQLSFTAVFAIMVALPAARKLLCCDEHGAVYGYVADTLAVSVIAQIGTLPLLWCYFGAFPLYFLLTNIVVVPVAFVIMVLAVLLWCVSPLPLLAAAVAWLLNAIVGAMNGWLRFVEALPCSSLPLPYIDCWVALGLAAVILSLFIALSAKSRRALLFSLLCLLSAGGWAVWLHSGEHSDYILFFNSRKSPAVQFVASRDSSYLLSQVAPDDEELEYVAHPYWRRERFSLPQFVHLDSLFRSDDFSSCDNMVHFCGRRVKYLSDSGWQDDSVKVDVDVLYLCKGFKGRVERLLELYPAPLIIMDAGLHYMTRRRVERESAVLNVQCIDLSSGAVRYDCADGNISR